MKNKKQHRPKRKRAGAPPGTLEFTGKQHLENPLVHRVCFNTEGIESRSILNGEELEVSPDKITWYDVRGLHDVELIERFGKHFNIHPLVLEDILNTQQRPKFEEYGDEVFVVISAIKFNPQEREMTAEQITIYFGKNFLLTFQENKDDTFLAVRERLESGRGRIRSKGSDYLAYALMDNVVDNYFQVLDQVETEMELIEADIENNPSKQVKARTHHLKFQLLTLRKSVTPLREAIGRFSRYEGKAMDEHTGLFARDLYDHVIRISDLIETYRDMLNGLQELYVSELSLRMNNVMQVLTIITTIFVPMSFLAGLYGMNFDHMPELHWQNGYYYLLGLMGLIFMGSIVYFIQKKWL